ncbi:DEAD-domain-containing protein [Clavulina sp. PMI_390]|nr:DEAD-domain-containing protein [Clavulina sp. PMI_390]
MGSSDSHKKKKSGSSSISTSTTLEAPAPQTSIPDAKQSKKRKRDKRAEDSAALTVGEAGPSDELEPSEKKKKKKKDHVLSEVLQLTTPASPVSETPSETDAAALSKKLKKEKKEKKRKDRELAAAASVNNGAIAKPSSSTRPVASAKDASEYLKSNHITIEPASAIVPSLSFDQVDIAPKLQQVLSKFEKPTPIQACAWPALLAGNDVVGIAETGSGKTLGFGLPALAHLTSSSATSSKNLTILVVAPTRELALQTHETMETIGAPYGIKSVCVFGGVDKAPQKKALASKNVRVVVGTPGRLLDLSDEGACDLSGISYLVLDEADRMLDRGFENDIRRIIGLTGDGSNRQTLMFSATWPESVRRLASTFLRSPIRITVGSDDLTANSRVAQSIDVFDDPRSKDKRLHTLLKSLNHSTDHAANEESRILIFVLYKNEADRVLETLRYIGFTAAAIHGDMKQAERMRSLDMFKTGQTGLLVATDVAARGLDIPNVGAVINYSFPLTIEDYIHRIGRTGRGGKFGKSFTFFTGDKHERALAGEFARVLRDGGFTNEADKLKKFPMTIKKKEHGAYGAFFRDDVDMAAKPTKIKF